MIYIIIFILKMIENMISTLRLIMISNNKSLAGALLHFICSIVFIISASLVIINFNQDIYKVLVFALGGATGSYLGSKLEEKIAIGENLIICFSTKNYLPKKLINDGYKITMVKTNSTNMLFIIIPRKIKQLLIDKVTEYDNNAKIIVENATKINK